MGRAGSRASACVTVPYEERMDLVYSAADLVVCRAGAMTVAELAVAGVPSILVPLPGAPGDHQTANARVLERAGAALVLPDPECDPATLAEWIDRLLDDPPRLGAMGRAASRWGDPTPPPPAPGWWRPTPGRRRGRHDRSCGHRALR